MVDIGAANKFKAIKMVVIGDGAVGKTSLIKWYALFSHLH
jgi:GTPase SAR1 family protein